jgi:hypothetical protein
MKYRRNTFLLTEKKKILSSKEEEVRQVVKYNFFYTVHLLFNVPTEMVSLRVIQKSY